MALSRAYHATERLVALGVARSSAVAIVRQVNTWLDSSGPEWTVRRLKDLKTAYTHHLNGDGWKPDWIAWRSGAPVGPFRFLWHHTTRKRAIRALNALMMYTSFVAPKATPTQIKKFMDSVLEPPGISPDLDLGLFSLPPMPVLKRKPWCGRLESSPPSPSRMMPVFGKSVPEDDPTAFGDMVREVRCLGFIDRFPKVWRELEDIVLTQPWRSWSGELPSVGKISFIQEPGYKLRAVANPNRLVQTSLRPLQNVIWDLLHLIDEDCTFDQGKGVSAAMAWLRNGQTVHSIDLSDATNVFPLDLQMQLLHRALPGWEEHLAAFHSASTMWWSYTDPLSKVRSLVRWKKGQPLGLAPSFGAFAFSHHCVARLARLRAGSGDYRILGDDIVITGDAMAREYRTLLDQLGCPISDSKTISGRIAEFAGKIITPESVIPTVKWRSISDKNFVEYARVLGPKSLPMFRPRQRAVLESIAELPEFWGGLGWNPNGKPLEDRMAQYEPLIQLIESGHEEEHTVTRVSWFSKYMWENQKDPRAIYSPFRPEMVREPGFVSHRMVVDVIQPVTESVQEGEHLPGYGPVMASEPYTVLDLIRWERLLREVSLLRAAK
jgi:hypothetical protein